MSHVEAIDGVVIAARKGEYNRIEGEDMIKFAGHYLKLMELRKMILNDLEDKKKPKDPEVKEQGPKKGKK